MYKVVKGMLGEGAGAVTADGYKGQFRGERMPEAILWEGTGSPCTWRTWRTVGRERLKAGIPIQGSLSAPAVACEGGV